MRSLPHIPLWLKLLGLTAGLLLAFFIYRAFSFNTDDVVLETDIPEEMDVGSELTVHATIINSTRATLRDGKLSVLLPQGIEFVEESETAFDALAFKGQHTATFRIRARANPGDERNVIVRAEFRPRQLSATFSKEVKRIVRFRTLPFSLNFSFPSDVTSGRPFTFFIRYNSEAAAPIGPVGLAITVPENFHISRARPAAVPDLASFWDLGMLNVGARDEIAVTGSFDADATGGEFIARIGMLDSARRSLTAFKEVREFLNLRAGAVPVDIFVGDTQNPREAIVHPGENIQLKLVYTNLTPSPVEDLSLLLAFAHPAIEQRNVSSSEDFARSVSGEYVWSPETVLPLRLVAPQASGTINFSARLEEKIPMRSFSESNQTITARARAVSGGEILGERQVVFKIESTLNIEAEVVFNNAPGGRNTGPIPPRVGQKTTYTVTLSVINGTNGLNDVVARVVLGPAVSYDLIIEPEDADIVYDAATREVRWDVGDVLAGTGTLSAPKTVTFRIGLTPRPEDVGTQPELISAVSATGTDNFTGRTLDAGDDPVDSTVPDDGAIDYDEATVQP